MNQMNQHQHPPPPPAATAGPHHHHPQHHAPPAAPPQSSSSPGSISTTNSPRRGPWSPAEDSRLLKLIDEHGPSNWVRISQLLSTRTPKQCRERFHQNLKPSLNHEPITEEEGMYIEQLVAQYGKKWAEIARHLNGRSDNAVKNWWNGGANRRRRSMVGDQPQQQPPQHHPQHAQMMAHHQQQHHHPMAAPPPHPGAVPYGMPPHQHALYQSYPSMGHRISLPNIHSTEYQRAPQPAPPPPPPGSHMSGYSMQPHQSQPPPPPPPPPQHQQQQQPPPPPPGVVFNSAYTTEASPGFGRSLSLSGPSHSVDPHQSATSPRPNPHQQAVAAAAAQSGSPFSRRRNQTEEIFPNTPYSRRVSINTTSTGYSSSRASSIGGVSSASDNEDPLHSLSKYSLSNSASTSRRNSAAPPIDNTVLPPLGSPTAPSSNGGASSSSSSSATAGAGAAPTVGVGFNPAYTYSMPQRAGPTQGSTPPPPGGSGHRHSVTGYPSPRLSVSGPSSAMATSNAANATSKLAESTNGNARDSTTSNVTTPTPNPSDTEQEQENGRKQIKEEADKDVEMSKNEPSSAKSGEKLKISNLLS